MLHERYSLFQRGDPSATGGAAQGTMTKPPDQQQRLSTFRSVCLAFGIVLVLLAVIIIIVALMRRKSRLRERESTTSSVTSSVAGRESGKSKGKGKPKTVVAKKRSSSRGGDSSSSASAPSSPSSSDNSPTNAETEKESETEEDHVALVMAMDDYHLRQLTLKCTQMNRYASPEEPDDDAKKLNSKRKGVGRITFYEKGEDEWQPEILDYLEPNDDEVTDPLPLMDFWQEMNPDDDTWMQYLHDPTKPAAPPAADPPPANIITSSSIPPRTSGGSGASVRSGSGSGSVTGSPGTTQKTTESPESLPSTIVDASNTSTSSSSVVSGKNA